MKVPLSPDEPTQQRYEVRFDWGREGLRGIARGLAHVVGGLQQFPDLRGDQLRLFRLHQVR